MKKIRGKLFQEVNVWRRIDDKTLLRYRCFKVLPDNRFCVRQRDNFSLPLDDKLVRQMDGYYVDSLFEGLSYLANETYETLEEAIMEHEKAFEGFSLHSYPDL